jgi:GNAT superfamily N-acetyltransferase
MRRASLNDVPQLVTMMGEFYSDSPYPLNRRRATDAFTALLADERLGHVWFIQSNSEDVGYVVVTLCHSMNFGGLVATIDDFFIKPAFRGVGLGKAAMEEVRNCCVSHGIRAVQVETGRDNAPALAVYRHAGFVDTGHVHLTLGLADPTHAP